jgi:hypothetical protein
MIEKCQEQYDIELWVNRHLSPVKWAYFVLPLQFIFFEGFLLCNLNYFAFPSCLHNLSSDYDRVMMWHTQLNFKKNIIATPAKFFKK